MNSSNPPKKDSPPEGKAAQANPESELASFSLKPQAPASPLLGRTRQLERQVTDPFIENAYNRGHLEKLSHAHSETSLSAMNPSGLGIRNMAPYMDPAIVSMEFPRVTPPENPFSGSVYPTGNPIFPPPGLPAPPPGLPARPPGLPMIRNPGDIWAPRPLDSPDRSPVQTRGGSQFPNSNERRFVIKNVDTDTEGLEIVELFQRLPSTNGPFWTTTSSTGRVFVSFSDSRDVEVALARIDQTFSDWDVCPLTAEDFTRETRLVTPLPMSFDDLVAVTLYCGTYSTIQPADVVVRIKPFLELVGKVHSIQELQFGIPSDAHRLTTHELSVKYFDSRHAANAVKTLNAVRTADFVMEVMPLYRDMPNMQHRHWTCIPKSRRNSVAFIGTPARRHYMSPSDPDSPPPPDQVRQNLINQNVIDLSRVFYDQDPRTTIMLRNLPNQMTWQQLKGVLDLTCPNSYDFLYLRMDFDHNQSVGYAFVNFINPSQIILFLEAREGLPWPGFENHVEKIAEMSYATIQGKDALVDKFRNSPVMLNHPDNRPKVFHTTGARAGRLASFPPVNSFYVLAKGVDRSRRSGLFRGPNAAGSNNTGHLQALQPLPPSHRSSESEDSGVYLGRESTVSTAVHSVEDFEFPPSNTYQNLSANSRSGGSQSSHAYIGPNSRGNQRMAPQGADQVNLQVYGSGARRLRSG